MSRCPRRHVASFVYVLMFLPIISYAFQERPLAYIPAWGSFCSYGISQEDWWTKDTLGPEADPDLWFITDEGVLHFFRRCGRAQGATAICRSVLNTLYNTFVLYCCVCCRNGLISVRIISFLLAEVMIDAPSLPDQNTDLNTHHESEVFQCIMLQFAAGANAALTSGVSLPTQCVAVICSPLPMSKFLMDVPANLEAGNEVWSSWWGEAAPGAADVVQGSPLNTNCFCSESTCVDG